jgi:SET domain-containing protein
MKRLLWVGKSRIAGKGLFTAQAIKKGTRILQYIGEKITKAESAKRLAQGNVYVFAFNDYWDIDGRVLRNKARYINHSCDPNCEVHMTSRTIWIVALRDIKTGEELTFNYGYELDDEMAQPCTCGAKHCYGFILAQKYWGVVKHSESIQQEDRVNPKKRTKLSAS